MNGFTDQGIRKLKPEERKITLTEGGGLYLQVSPKGQKTWYHRYMIGKRRKWYRLGDYPALSLKDARAENVKMQEITTRGEDPQEIINEEPTVRQFFELWLSKATDKKGHSWSEAHRYNTECMFKADVLPRIGGIKVSDVRKRDIRALLENVEERAPNQALQLYRRLSRLFNWAAEKDIIEASPMANLSPIGTQGEKDRYLSAQEIKQFIQALPDTGIAPSTAAILEIILRTGQRPSEVCGAHESEFQGEWWILPPERTKNRLEHRTYISPLVKKLFGVANEHGLFFPSLKVPSRPVLHGTLSKSLRRLTQGKEKRTNNITVEIESFSPHDLRRTCATHLAELGHSDEVIGAILNHKKRSITARYNRFQYDKEKQRALLSWERRLDDILHSRSTSNVININVA